MVSSGIEADSPGVRGRDLRAAKLGLWLGLLGFLAFVSTLGNDFVAWDDPDNFVDNIGFRGIGWNNLRWAWTNMIIGVYQPVAWMILEVEYLGTGMDPYGYHLASTLMHGVNTAVLFALTLAILGRARPDLAAGDRSSLLLASAFSTALFAAHPMRSEVVAWASAQPYLPCAFFSMLSVLAYLKANPTGEGEVRSRWLLASFGLYALAVLSKAAAIPLPAVLLVVDVFPLGRLGGRGSILGAASRRAIVEKVPFFVLGGVFMIAAVIARICDRNLDPVANTGLGGRVSLSCFSAMFYPVKSLWPSDLHAFYMRPKRASLFGPIFLLAIGATLATTAGLVANRKRRPGLLAAWVAYLLILAPVSGLVTTGMQLAADRYAYLSMMAFVPPLAAGLCDLAPSLARLGIARRGRIALASGLILGLVVLSFIQNRSWRDSEALWTRGIEHGAGHVADLHNNLGAVWASKGHYELAIFAFNEALRLKPEHSAARGNLKKAIGHRESRPDPGTTKAPKAG